MLFHQEKKEGISLRTLYAFIIIGTIVIAGLMFYTTFSLGASFQTLTEASENQIALDKAAHELMDASDYLTDRVQRFTVDGDIRFLNDYFTEAFETNRRESAIEKMSGDPASAAALEQLQEAMDESLELMNREYYAMRLVIEAKGITEYPRALESVMLRAEDAALSPEKKMQLATRTVLDDAYFALKDRIRADMRESLDMLEAITRNTESAAFEHFRSALILVRVIIVLLTLGILFLIWLTVRLDIKPVLKAVDRIRDGRPIQERGASEFRYLAQAYNKLTEKLKQENDKLKHVSRTDALTGTLNRMALRDDYDSYREREVTVMLLDLDHFKMINDTYGHEEGDRVLRETGNLLTDVFRKEHCYRYGGDEFLVIYPDCSEEAFLAKLNIVMENAPLFEANGETSRISYSAGCVHAKGEKARDLRDLFSEADKRMYRNKRDKARSDAIAGGKKSAHQDDVGIMEAEYTASEMKALLDNVSGMYDLARVVDPIECRILEFGSDGTISRKERCYGIWSADQKCVNCSSALACRTGCRQQKTEAFHDQVYHIQSNPVRLKLDDGGAYDAVVELVSIEKENRTAEGANDRAAENENHRAAQYQAQHDTLTKTLNPDAFSELSREKLVKSSKQPWVMVTGNIMNFRLINTLFGVQRGNEAIVRTAAVLQKIALDTDGLCCRLGGDQFAVLLPKDLFREELLTDAARTLAAEFSSGIYTFCIHFGVYVVTDTSIPVSAMCDRANTALRTIREAMTETVAYFDDTMMRKILFEQEVISGFESALRDGQFRMHLQPLAHEDGRILGGEALVRWHRPDGAVIMPGEFIETLERAGLIHELDVYIWECAVRQLAAWNGTPGERFAISVNMSAKDLYTLDVYQVLTGLIARYGVPAERLRVEITETALLEDPANSNAVISRLRQRGFLVEIDDFGKGFSSLSTLKDIHADVLKIDMSLLNEIETRQRSRTILASIINMARSLGMDVVTEGIETKSQLQSLAAMGCEIFQGYYFSRPITVEEFELRYLRPEPQKES